MKELEVGDKIRIRKDLHNGNDYGVFVNTVMPKYAGKTAKITYICSGTPVHYKLDIDEDDWDWSADIFEECEFSKSDLENGMIGITRGGLKFIFLNGVFMTKEGGSCLCRATSLEEDLTLGTVSCEELDIVRVCKSKGDTLNEYFNEKNFTTIWERKPEVKEMTIEEIKKALNIKCEFKIKEN